MPLTNSPSLLHTYFSKDWYPDCENWYKIWFKFTCRVRALGAFIRNNYLACQQRPETKNLGDEMSATSCKTGTSCVFRTCLLARWQGSGMERAVACREEHYVMYLHLFKDAPEVCTSTSTIFKTNNLRLVLLFCDLLSLSHFLGQGFFTWVCLSNHIQFAKIVLNSFLVPSYWKFPRHALLVCLFVWVSKTNPITGLSGWRTPD